MTEPAPRLLLIDNYDSFTYNLVQYLGELGCELTVWRNDAFTLDDVRALNPDAIVVSPGPCTPREAGQSVAVIRELGPTVPTLGVCLGHQSIGEAFGARVERAVLPPELVATAWTTDPEEEVVMALRHRDYPVYGVQFHPESVATQHGKAMLRNFLDVVRGRLPGGA